MDASSSIISRSTIPFKIAGIERMRIDSSGGYVGIGTTTPSQLMHINNGNCLVSNGYLWSSSTPSFTVTISAESSDIKSTTGIVQFNTVLSQTGSSAFNTTAYNFPAPVAGIYVFNAKVRFSGAGAYTPNMGTFSIGWSKNGASPDTSFEGYAWDTTRQFNNNYGSLVTTSTRTYNLAAGDTVGVYQSNGATAALTIGNDPGNLGKSLFSGYLLTRTG